MKRRKNLPIVLSTNGKSLAWNRCTNINSNKHTRMHGRQCDGKPFKWFESKAEWERTNNHQSIERVQPPLGAHSCERFQSRPLPLWHFHVMQLNRKYREEIHTLTHDYIYILCEKVNHLFSLGGLPIMSFELRRVSFNIII